MKIEKKINKIEEKINKKVVKFMEKHKLSEEDLTKEIFVKVVGKKLLKKYKRARKCA